MQTISASTLIERSPESVFAWFSGLDRHYKEWHPDDHVKAKFTKGDRLESGSVLSAEEYLGGKLERFSFVVTKVIPDKLIEFRLGFPVSLICTGGYFMFEPCAQGCNLTAALSFRFGRLLEALMPGRVNALRKHMKEEGENLKGIMEKTPTGSDR